MASELSSRTSNIWEDQSKVITSLRFPLSLWVVFIHVLPFTPEYAQSGLPLSENVYRVLSATISNFVGVAVVLCFFIFSAYYLFLKLSVTESIRQTCAKFYVQEQKKRIRSLLIPYILWNTIYLVLAFAKLSLSVGDTSIERSMFYDIPLWLHYWTPVDFPLWFVRDLMIVNALFPLYFLMARHLGRSGMAGLLWGIGMGWTIFLDTSLLRVAIFYYGLGAFLGIFRIPLLTVVRRLRPWVLILAIPILILINMQIIGTTEFLPVLIFAIMLISLGDWIYTRLPRVSRWFVSMAPTSFFIYALHLIYVESLLKGAFSRMTFFASGWGQIVAYFLIPIITVGICLGAYYALRAVMPRILAILSGGRG